METKRVCPSCQKTLPPNVPLGLCPECLIKSGFNTGTEPGNPGKESGFVPPPVEEIRKLFPQLEIIELVGQGGMGAVYKARQPTLDRFVALKILPPDSAKDAGFAERFNREARALARLNHPHIVAVHDFGQAGGQPYLVMEFVDGLNLRQVEQAGRLPPEQALEIVPQICEALQFAHNEGVVHRDIKPENILLDKKGRLKITDFGIAKIVGVPAGKISLTGAKDFIGTLHYMAPEQVEKPATVDHRADIYSLGVVFYEMLTGELPLGKFQPPSKKVQVDVRLDEVVLHALEKEPERRYQHASEVKTDVETITNGLTQAAPSLVSQEQLTKLSKGSSAATVRVVNKIAWSIFGLLMLIGAVVDFNHDRFSELARLSLIAATILSLAVAVTVFAIYLINYRFRIGRGGREEVPSPKSEINAGCPLTPVTTTQTPVNVENVRRQLNAPAIGLVVTGILNWLAIPYTFLVTTGVVSQIENRGSYMILVPLSAFVLSSVMIVAGLKMKRLEAYGLAVAGSVLAILVTPGNVIGLPLGIWALVVLSHREVREAFGKGGSFLLESGAAAPPVPRPDRFWQRFAVAIVLVLLALLMIPVGAIVLSIALPALNRAKVKMQSKSEPAQLSLLFGPVIERIVNDLDENRGDEALNFRTGQLLSLPADFEQRREAWLNDNGVDLLVDFARDRWALVSRGMQFRDLANEQWKRTDALGGVWPESEVLEKRESRGGTFYLLSTNSQPPLTFGFQTSRGDLGMLRIVGLLDNPRGMKLRYKLATLSGGGGGLSLDNRGGSDAATLTQEGWQLWQGGRPADAIPKFEAAVKLDPTNTAAWNGLGWASFNSGKTPEAEKAFQKVIELEADHPATLNGLGQVYLTQKKYTEAESYLLKAAPKAPASWYGLARLYLLQGKFEQAEKWAQNIVDSGQADESTRAMLQAARDKKLSDGLRLMIEPQ